MTTIRRIVVSQIDGNGADTVDNNELRPFGETSFYIDNNDKLTLLMFDGTRTHRKSKVLAPGVLWGSNADAGDGSLADTIKLIPDAELFANGSNQYIIVDPTAGEPGHIHLRAGGTQDSSSADLYLGGERTFVRVSDTYDNVAIGTTGTNANFWVFGSDGLLTLPSGNTTIGNFYGSDAILCSTGTAFGIVSQGAGSSVLQWLDDINAPNVIAGIAVNSLYSNTGSVQIYTGAIGSPPQNTWTFGTDSRLILPGGSSIDVSTYDVSLVAGDDGSSTYGHVTLKTNGPNGVNEFYMNSLGELTLPRGGVIQETEVINELHGTTTTSLTLVPAGAANGTQRLEIYSTAGGEGNHIHITSGDQNQTDLFLGNDTQYFAVGAMGQNEIRARRGLDSPTTGTSAYAGSPVWIYAGDAGDNGGNTIDGALGGDIFLQAGISSNGLGGQILLQSGYGPDGAGSIKLSTDGGSGYLEFDKNDQLTFPSGGGIIFDSSATSTITGISSVIFADSTEQTTAWLAGGSSSLTTTFISVNDFPNASFINSSSVSLNYSAYSGGPSFNFTIDCQAPLTENTGIDVGAVKTPYILSTSTVELKTNLGASTSTWIFDTIGGLQFPDNTVQSTAFKIGTVPVTSTSTGEVNTIAFNESYFYVCTATNSWQRIGWDATPW